MQRLQLDIERWVGDDGHLAERLHKAALQQALWCRGEVAMVGYRSEERLTMGEGFVCFDPSCFSSATDSFE